MLYHIVFLHLFKLCIVCGEYKTDKLTNYFQSLLEEGLSFKQWFSGHYHEDTIILNKYQILYDKIIRIN